MFELKAAALSAQPISRDADIEPPRSPIGFATFWSGPPLSAFEQACLSSFAEAGYAVTIYAFEAVEALPRGVAFGDARAIVPEQDRTLFLYRGKPNTQHFTDYFRYLLFRETGEAWIDTDMVLLRPFAAERGETILAKETPHSICNAIMCINSGEAILPELIRRAERLRGKDLVWGATGPRLLNHVVGRRAVLERARPASEFFPIHYDSFWMSLLPECADECAARCANAFTLHLWNNLLAQLGYWKTVAPPAESYLWRVWRNQGVLRFFETTYPADIMRQMVQNYRLRKSGADIGIVQTTRQLFPSLGRTLKPRLKALQQLGS